MREITLNTRENIEKNKYLSNKEAEKLNFSLYFKKLPPSGNHTVKQHYKRKYKSVEYIQFVNSIQEQMRGQGFEKLLTPVRSYGVRVDFIMEESLLKNKGGVLKKWDLSNIWKSTEDAIISCFNNVEIKKSPRGILTLNGNFDSNIDDCLCTYLFLTKQAFKESVPKGALTIKLEFIFNY